MSDDQPPLSPTVETFIEKIAPFAFTALSESDREALLCLRPFFEIVSREGDLYCRSLGNADELDATLIQRELSLVLGTPVRRVALVSNRGPDRPWGSEPSEGFRTFAGALYTARFARLYKRGRSTSDLGRVKHLCFTELGAELSSNLRATFKDGLEDQVYWGIDVCFEALVLATLIGDRDSRDRLARFFPILLSCAPFAKSQTEPDTWFVFAR